MGDTVTLQMPLTQGGTNVEAGTKGEVKAVYPAAGLVDVQFDGIKVPEYDDGIIRTNTLSVKTEFIQPDLDVHPDHPAYDGPMHHPGMNDEIDYRKQREDKEKADKESVRTLLSNYIRSGRQDKDEFIRMASRRLQITEPDVEELLDRI